VADCVPKLLTATSAAPDKPAHKKRSTGKKGSEKRKATKSPDTSPKAKPRAKSRRRILAKGEEQVDQLNEANERDKSGMSKVPISLPLVVRRRHVGYDSADLHLQLMIRMIMHVTCRDFFLCAPVLRALKGTNHPDWDLIHQPARRTIRCSMLLFALRVSSRLFQGTDRPANPQQRRMALACARCSSVKFKLFRECRSISRATVQLCARRIRRLSCRARAAVFI
jgi:hypothetical protein